MGRTIVPYRWIFEQEKNYWYKKLKNTQHTKEITELYTGGAYYSDAGHNWSMGQVRDKVLFILVFSQYKELVKLKRELKNKQYQ